MTSGGSSKALKFYTHIRVRQRYEECHDGNYIFLELTQLVNADLPHLIILVVSVSDVDDAKDGNKDNRDNRDDHCNDGGFNALASNFHAPFFTGTTTVRRCCPPLSWIIHIAVPIHHLDPHWRLGDLLPVKEDVHDTDLGGVMLPFELIRKWLGGVLVDVQVNSFCVQMDIHFNMRIRSLSIVDHIEIKGPGLFNCGT